MSTRSIIIIVAVLLLVTGGVFLGKDKWSTTGTSLEKIIPGTDDDINSILIINGSDSLFLQKKKDHWFLDEEALNDKAVENLLLATSSLSLKGIVSAEEIPDQTFALRLVFKNGKSVRSSMFFGKLGKAYFVSDNKTEELYLVELTGYEDYQLEKIISPNPDHYRKHVLIDLLPDEIRTIKLSPISGSPFVLQQDDNFDIQVFSAEGASLTEQASEHKMRMLLTYFNAIRYERVADNFEKERLLAERESISQISIETFSGESFEMIIFPFFKEAATDSDPFESLMLFNNDPEVYVINYYYLDLIMRGFEKYRVPSAGN